jgi:hypothetical protein
MKHQIDEKPPAIAASTTAQAMVADVSQDARLLELGSQLDQALGEESVLWKKTRRLGDAVDFDEIRKILSYRPNSSIDHQVVELLGEFEWSVGNSFTPADVEDLKSLAKTGKKSVDGRIQQIIKANDQFTSHFEQPNVREANRQAEQASKRTGEIVGLIAAEPARTLQGLVVKAKAVSWCWSGELDDVEEIGTTTDMSILRTMVQDLVALGQVNRRGKETIFGATRLRQPS